MLPFFLSLRPSQWLKNFILFAALTFNGQLFNQVLLVKVIFGIISFSLLSSASYLINDLKDLPYDKQHPVKKYRPIASGRVTKTTALSGIIILSILGFFIAYSLSLPFFIIGALFLLLHIAYTFGFKKFAALDIFTIAFSFTLRAFAGEVLTGLHIPVWLILTIVFLSLFVASSKRHSELLGTGISTRPTLLHYQERLLDFYATTFATATVLSYALFVFFEEPPIFNSYTQEFLRFAFPIALQRKWLILTVPFVLLGIMRYGQLVYAKKGAEAPEKLITQDVPLLLIAVGWGLMAISILYLI